MSRAELAGLMLFVSMVLFGTTPLSGQERKAGVVAGGLCARQIWQPSEDTSCLYGPILGIYAVSPTPAPWVSIHAEATYTRRGSIVEDDQGLAAQVSSHVVSGPVLVRFAPPSASVQPFVETGVSLEYLLRTRADPALTAILRDEAKIGFNAVVAAGVSIRLRDDLRLELWGRLTEGLNKSYRGDFISMRNRSQEISIGVLKPF